MKEMKDQEMEEEKKKEMKYPRSKRQLLLVVYLYSRYLRRLHIRAIGDGVRRFGGFRGGLASYSWYSYSHSYIYLHISIAL